MRWMGTRPGISLQAIGQCPRRPGPDTHAARSRGSGRRTPRPGARSPAAGSSMNQQGVTGAIALGPGADVGGCNRSLQPWGPASSRLPQPRRQHPGMTVSLPCSKPQRPRLLCQEVEAPWHLASDDPGHLCLCWSFCLHILPPFFRLTKATSLPGPSASPTGLDPLGPRH